jgi:hypothetical protein
MDNDQDRAKPRGRRARLKRAIITAAATALFLAAGYGAGFYGLTAKASHGPIGKPCTADNTHPFQHGGSPCATTSTSTTGSGPGITDTVPPPPPPPPPPQPSVPPTT